MLLVHQLVVLRSPATAISGTEKILNRIGA